MQKRIDDWINAIPKKRDCETQVFLIPGKDMA